jgi:flavin-dependent thymidylate synthase
MTVTLLSHTPDALNLLLRTKNTRLKLNSDPSTWSDAQRAEHLAYMRDTIKSSWEFVDYTFQIDGVTRAFTHQLVRTRTGSYAQESQRTVDVRDNQVLTPEPEPAVWRHAVEQVMGAYADMINSGTPAQDARGILPTNVTTSIIAKFTLRTLSDMARVRLCVRTQGEYQTVFRAMRDVVLAVHPWAEDFIQVECCASGTCAFPRYGRTQCTFWDPSMDRTDIITATRVKFWSGARQVAVPVAQNGRTM